MSTVKISTLDGGLPSIKDPVEGVDYAVEAGNPADGDMTRVIAGTSVQFKYHAAPGTPAPRPNTMAHKSIVRIRAKNLAKQGKNVEAIMLLKTIGE